MLGNSMQTCSQWALKQFSCAFSLSHVCDCLLIDINKGEMPPCGTAVTCRLDHSGVANAVGRWHLKQRWCQQPSIYLYTYWHATPHHTAHLHIVHLLQRSSVITLLLLISVVLQLHFTHMWRSRLPWNQIMASWTDGFSRHIHQQIGTQAMSK